MKRAFLLAFLILLIDQGFKTFSQINFKGKEIFLFKNFGLTYVQNEALWINPSISNHLILLLFSLVILVWVYVVFLMRLYIKKYRKSLIVDFAFAFYTVGVLGNIIDKVIFGYIRDFVLASKIVFNFADIFGILGILIFCFEFIFYPESRKLLNFSQQLEK